MNGTIAVKTKVEKHFKLKLSREQVLAALQEKYNIPDAASVFVHVPGGGDWSNTNLDIEHQTPLEIHWVE
jgi:hypothetical protein